MHKLMDSQREVAGADCKRTQACTRLRSPPVGQARRQVLEEHVVDAARPQ